MLVIQRLRAVSSITLEYICFFTRSPVLINHNHKKKPARCRPGVPHKKSGWFAEGCVLGAGHQFLEIFGRNMDQLFVVAGFKIDVRLHE